MSDYLYLYRGGMQPSSPEQMQKTMQRWIAWVTELGESGHLVERGYPLEDASSVVSGAGKVVTDGPYAESKDLVGGFTIVKAADIAEASELAKGCPIFDTGGSVEVRPIRPMNT